MRLTLPNYRAFIVVVLLALLAFSGCNKSDDTTPLIPAVTTSAIIVNPTTTGAQVSGTVTNFISGTISAYGVCWSSTNKTPTIADTKTTLTTANTVRFSSDMTGLTANTLYYIRAYATSTSTNTTEYGSVIQFTTPTTTFSLKGTTSTFAGTGAEGYADLAKASALFSSPQGVVADAAGNFYIADSFNNVIRKISAAGLVTTLAGNPTPGYANGTGTAASFYSPQYIAIDASGNLYVTDVGNNAIRKVTPLGVVTTLAGGNGVGYADGSLTTTPVKFYNPAGLAVDATGNVYVADKGNNIIRKITPAGVTSTLAGNTTAGFVDAVGTAAFFRAPIGVAVDANNNVYVADQGNNAIRMIVAADGTTTTYIGGPTQADALDLPTALAFDKTGNLFVSDAGGRILELTATTKVLWNIAGNAKTAGYTEGAGTAAKFNRPQGITTDAAGAVYVADYNNNVIRKLTVATTP